MKRHLYILILWPLFTFCKQHKEAKTATEIETVSSENVTQQNATYYLIRHAEKDRTDPGNQDPALNLEGLLRAEGWATYFEPLQIDQIYSSDYLRTRQTVAVVAKQKMLSPIVL